MATKGGKRAAAKKGTRTPTRVATKAAAPPKTAAPEAKSGAAAKGRATTPPRIASRGSVALPPASPRVSAGPSLLERAERFRDAVQQSKLAAADPWTYTAKARGWTRRAQALVDEVARAGATLALGKNLEALIAEVEADHDYQEANRRA